MSRQTVFLGVILAIALLLAGILGWRHVINKPSATRLASGMLASKRREEGRQPAAGNEATPRQAAARDSSPAAGKAGDAGLAPPTFDIARVAPDGMAVLAGRAAPRARVEVLLDGKPVATITADEHGEWAFTPGKPLFSGAHQLTLRARAGADSGKAVMSRQTLTVSMQPVSEGGKPLVLLAAPDAPTRVLQRSEAPRLAKAGAAQAARKASGTAEAGKRQGGESAPPSPPSRRQAQGAGKSEEQGGAKGTSDGEHANAAGAKHQQSGAAAPPATGGGAVRATPGQSASGQAAPKPAKAQGQTALALRTVDYDSDGAIFFTGRGRAGAVFRLYVDNHHLGDVRADDSGRWAWRGKADISPGRHALRIDRIDAAGKVRERIELPFVRETARAVMQARAAARGAATRASAPGETAPGKPAAAATEVARGGADLRRGASTDARNARPVAKAPEPGMEQGAARRRVASAAGQTADGGAAGGVEKAGGAVGVVIVQPGNNLWNISRVLYGKGVRYTTIYEANRQQIRNPDLIYPGQVFTAPGVPGGKLRINPRRRRPASPEELRKAETLR